MMHIWYWLWGAATGGELVWAVMIHAKISRQVRLQRWINGQS